MSEEHVSEKANFDAGGLTLRNELTVALHSRLDLRCFTKVQLATIPQFLAGKDVIVQAPTGSGKTLAYLVPVCQMLLKASPTWLPNQVGALIVVPARELCHQVSGVAERLAAECGLTVCALTGGRSAEQAVQNFSAHGGNIVVGTPGRLEHVIADPKSDMAKRLRSLEVLVLDEADRLTDLSFTNQLSTILGKLPKQRRTALFSATPCNQRDTFQQLADLLKFGQRQTCHIVVDPAGNARVDAEDDDDECTTSQAAVTPDSLTNFYLPVAADAKLSHLLAFLRTHRQCKVVVFASTCACVEYLHSLLTALWRKNPPLIMAIHGKKRAKRTHVLDRFRSATSGVLLCTDVMARGIDVRDVDWVLQLDPPRQSSWFVHRSGRAGRQGRRGSGLAFLLPNEAGYVDYLASHEHVRLLPLEHNMKIPDTRKLREKIVKLASKDRDLLLRGTKAYVSYIQSYAKHDCHMLCRLNELDCVGVAHDYGLLRLPKMPELCNRDLAGFERVQCNTADVPFKDVKREAQRLVTLEERREETAAARQRWEERQQRSSSQPQQKQGKKRRRAPKQSDVDDIDSDYKLIRKLKRRKITKADFDTQFDC